MRKWNKIGKRRQSVYGLLRRELQGGNMKYRVYKMAKGTKQKRCQGCGKMLGDSGYGRKRIGERWRYFCLGDWRRVKTYKRGEHGRFQ